MNTNITYSVPTAANLPNGFVFNSWTVTPGTYMTTGGLNNRDLIIKFTAVATYTLTAKFSLSNNTTYSTTKTIDVLPSITPVITGPSEVCLSGCTFILINAP